MVKILIIKGKKGSEEFWPLTDILFFIIFGIILGFTAIGFVILIASSGAEITQIKNGLESYFLTDRILKSSNCLALSDNSASTIYAGHVDFTKFNDLQLNNCFNALSQDDVAFKLTLSSEFISELPKTIKTMNWNDNMPIEKIEQTRNAVIFYSNNIHNGEMSIEIQNYK